MDGGFTVRDDLPATNSNEETGEKPLSKTEEVKSQEKEKQEE